MTLDDEALKKQAVEWAKVVARDDKMQKLSVIFMEHSTGKVKRIAIDRDKLKAIGEEKPVALEQMGVSEGHRFGLAPEPPLAAVPGVLKGKLSVQGEQSSTAASSSAAATSSAASSAVPTSSSPSASYLADRQKVVDRISKLQSRGVGTKPYLDEVLRLDNCYKHGDNKALLEGLDKLRALLTHNEATLQAMIEQKAQAQANTAAASRGGAGGGGGLPGYGGADPNQSIANFKGSGASVFNELIREHVRQTLGDGALTPGPFGLERYRVAVRIKELEAQGKDVRAVKGGYQRIEGLIKTNSSSNVSQIASELRYLQRQLGLPELGAGGSSAGLPPGLLGGR